MYYNEENTRGGLIKSLLIRLLFIILFILILVWLFPTKNSLNPLYQGIFRDNLDSMKEAAETYFTNERLPLEDDKSVKLTLEEMLNKNLLLPFVDKNGNTCDLKESYVEITKKDTEYELKVNLSCSDQEAYVIEHMGCTDKCAILGQCGTTCSSCGLQTNDSLLKEYEFKREVENKIVTGYTCPSGYVLDGTTCKKEVTSTDNQAAIPVYESTTSTQIIGYRCDNGYTLDETNKLCKKTTVDSAGAIPNYKDETTTISSTPVYTGKTESVASTPTYTNKTDTINATSNTSEVTKYLYKYMKTVTTTKEVDDTSKPIWYNTYDNIIGYQTKYVCSSFNYFIDQSSQTIYQANGDWSYQGTETMSAAQVEALSSSQTKKYVITDIYYEYCQGTCTVKAYYKVAVYTRSVTALTQSQYSNLSVTCNVTTKQVPIYGMRSTFVGYEKSKTTTVDTLTEWSTSKTDQSLISKNYGYVGIMKIDGTTTITTYTCPAGYTKSNDEKTCSKTMQVISGYTCPAGYSKSSDGKTCSKYINTITGYICPAGYTKSNDGKTCSKTNTIIASYTCPTGYTYDSIAQVCKKITTDTKTATPVYQSSTNNKIIGYRCENGYALTNNNRCEKTINTIATKPATASYKTSYGVEYMWSTATQVSGWTRTGNERTRIVTTTTNDNSNKQK